jgi:hypothetical protein
VPLRRIDYVSMTFILVRVSPKFPKHYHLSPYGMFEATNISIAESFLVNI